MSSIVNTITSIFESIVQIPITIAEWFQELIDNILELPTKILDGIKSIFIPDVEVINEQFETTLSNLKGRLGITVFNLDNLFSSSLAPNDINNNYHINGVGTLNLKFVDYKYLIDGVNFFRPFIRGLIVLLLFFFNIRQLLSMFALDSGEMTTWLNNSRGRDS